MLDTSLEWFQAWWWPYAFGVLVLVALLFIVGLALKGKLRSIIVGEDGHTSTSKFQIVLWTIVIIFAYSAIFTRNPWDVMTDIPANVLTVLGISLVTGVVAKGITSSYVETGRITQKTQPKEKASLREIFYTDDGRPDLAKIQMLSWTFIAVFVYLVRLVGELQCFPGTACANATAALAAGTAAAAQTAAPALPDIDTALMILMGLGSGTYLGDKLTSSTKPRITGLSTGSGKPGDSLTISGEFFGDSQGGSFITFDGTPLKFGDKPPQWKNTLIILTIPDNIFGSSRVTPEEGQKVQVGVTVGGVESNTVPFALQKKP